MRVLLNKQESAALGKNWAAAGTTYRVRKQEHRVFEVRRGALRGLVGKRRGTLVKHRDFPRGLRAFPRGPADELAAYRASEEDERLYKIHSIPQAEVVPVAKEVSKVNVQMKVQISKAKELLSGLLR